MDFALPWPEVQGLRVRLPAHVVFRALAAETVLLNIESGQYYAVDGMGGRFLEVLGAADSVGRAASELAAEYGQPLERVQEDLAVFLAALGERGLLAPA